MVTSSSLSLPLSLGANLASPSPSHCMQVQYSLLDRRPENGMVAYCKANDIKLLPYGVLAGGFLSEKYLGAKASSIKVDT